MTQAVTVGIQGPPGPVAANLASLSALATLPSAPYPNGTVVYVTATKSYWQLDTASTLTPDGATVIAATGATGNWVLLLPYGQAASKLLPAELNTMVRGPINDPMWAIAIPGTGPKVQINDEANGLYGDGALVNPYADAPSGSYLMQLFAAPPGATSLTINRQRKTSTTLGNPAATVMDLICDGSGNALASNPHVLSAAATFNPVTYNAVVPGNTYQWRTLVNDNAHGSSVQAQYEDLGGTAVFGGATGLFATPFQRLHITPGAFQDNLEQFNTSTLGHYITSTFASVSFDTNATQLVLEYISTIWVGPGPDTGFALAIYVNDRLFQTVMPTSNNISFATFTLPPGTKRVTVVTDEVSGGTLGTFLRAMYVPAQAFVHHVAVDTEHRRLVVYGDSIACGGVATPGVTRGWTARLRQQFPGRVVIEAYGGRKLNTDCATAAGRAALAQKIAACRPTDVWLAIGVNDWGQSTTTAATYAANYGAFLDELHALIPAATLWAQTPVINGTEHVANANSEWLRDFRELGPLAQQSTRTAFCNLVYGPSLFPMTDITGNGGDNGYHPGNSGNDKYARGAAGLLGLQLTTPTVTSPASITTSGAALYDFWETNQNVVQSSGNITTWTGKAAGYVFAPQVGHVPTFPGANTQNGFQSINGNGSQWLTQTASHSLTSPATAALVVRANSVGAPATNDTLIDSLQAGFNAGLLFDTTPAVYSTGPNGSLGISTGLVTTSCSIIWVVWNGNPNAQVELFNQSYSAPTTKQSAAGVNSNSGTAINGFWLMGHNNGSTGSRGVNVQIYGFYAWSGALSEFDRNVITEGYLKPTFGL